MLAPSPGGILPLSLGRQSANATSFEAVWCGVGPGTKGIGVGPRDVDDWMLLAAVRERVRARPIWMAPGRACHRDPPRRCLHGLRCRLIGLVCQLPLKDEGPAETLGLADKPGSFGKRRPLSIAHLGFAQPKARHVHMARRALTVCIKGGWRDAAIVMAHDEFATFDPYELWRWTLCTVAALGRSSFRELS